MKSKARILILNPKSQFGYGAGYFYYCKYLKHYFNIDFLCFDKALPKVQEDGVNIIYYNFNRNKIVRILAFLFYSIRMSRQYEYNSIFCVYFNLAFIVGLFARGRIKVLDVRTGSLSENFLKRYFDNRAILLTSVFFNKITTLSINLMSLLRLPRRKTVLLPLGAEVLDKTPKWFGNKFHLIYVGSLQKRCISKTIKGFWMFFKDYGQVASLKYDIIGFSPDRNDEEELKNTIKRFNLTGIVSFHGRKNHMELYKYFRDATIGVCFVPKKPYYDVQPSTKIFEYALSGLVTVATDTSENRKLITNKNGVLCKDDALSFRIALQKVFLNFKNYSDPEIRKSLARYNWKQITENILLDVLAK